LTRSGTIYLLRHGRINQSVPRRFVGQLDLPLDEEGLRQARAMHHFLRDIDFAGIFTSPLQRSRQTAQILAGSREIVPTPLAELAEINLGAWEGLTVDEVRRRFPGQYEKRGEDLAHYRPEGGESFHDLARRILPVFVRLAEENRWPLLVVAHAGVNRVLLASLQQLPFKDLLQIPQDYCCLNIIRVRDGIWHVDAINQRI